MEALSILIMSWRDIRNPAAGGAEVFTHEVAKRWAQRGHRVTVLTSRYEDAPREELLDGVRIVRQGGRFTVYRRVKQAYLERFRNGGDIVLDEINTRPFLAPSYVEGDSRVFALIFQLAREFWSYEMPFPMSVLGRYWLEDRWLRTYRRIPTFTISESTKKDLVALGFEDVKVVYAGVPVQPLREVPEKEREPTLVFVGRLKRAKLPDHAIRAFERVKDRVPHARLWVVGDGYLREKLERNAPEGVVFCGRLSESEKLSLMRRAHVLLYPAVREGWGLTVLEANALGTPVVGYDVPGLRDSIRNGETGILVPFGDISGLANAAATTLLDPSARSTMSLRAMRWAESFSWDDTAEAIMDRLRAGENMGAGVPS